MKKNRTPEQLRKLLDRSGIDFAQCVHAFGETEATNAYVRAANVQCEEGELEVDNTTVVSESERGAYVMGWIWVSDDDAFPTPTDVLEAVASAINQFHETPELAAKRAWLTDVLERKGAKIDSIESQPAAAAGTTSAPVKWHCKGVDYRFMPSAALTTLIEGGRVVLDSAKWSAANEFVKKFGDAFDALLCPRQRLPRGATRPQSA